MKILITGGLGFIGSHLTKKLLEKNHKITIVTKSLKKKSNLSEFPKNLKIIKADVSKQKSVDQVFAKYSPDLIIHLAGQTSHSRSFDNVINDLDSNTRSTLLLLEKIRTKNINCKFILGSTFIVIGKPKKLPIDENSECNPTNLYATHRLTSEYYCKIYNQVFGLKNMIFRITNAYGPNEQTSKNKNAINYLIHQAYTNQSITIYNKGKIFRDFIYISDVISAIQILIQKGKPGELYWIANGTKTSLNNFSLSLKKQSNCSINYIESPKYTKKVDVGNFIVNNNKIKKLGWKPKIPLNKGINLTLNSFKKNQK
tara:strand:- start:1907 stop:2845 length:939 start_codon:yes stop_codon:yes gene_type:complete